jgi:hypothetical protein
MTLNPDSIIHIPFQLNILRVEHYLLKGNLSPLERGSVKVLIKMIKFTFSISLNF